jgi:hypothetical protein
MDFLKTPQMRLVADAKVQAIIDEMRSGEADEVAWAKALKSAKGNIAYAEALYIEERIKRLADFEHVMAAQQKVDRLKYLEEEIEEIDKVGGRHSRILSLLVLFCLPFAVVLFWEGDVELGAAVVVVMLCAAIFGSFKLSRLDKQREKIKSELDTLSPSAQPSSWLGILVALAVASLTLGYLLS